MEKKLIITITLCLSFFVNSVMFGWEATRRTADDRVKINQSYKVRTDEESSQKIQSCLDGGGLPDYNQGRFSDCKKK